MADAPDFVNSLCDWLAERAGLAGTNPIRLWAYSIEDVGESITVPVSRLTRYDGRPIGTAPVGHSVIQCYTRSKLIADAVAQSEKLRAALHDADGMPVIETAITGHHIKAISSISTPSFIGRDGLQRAEIVFNFEVHHLPA